MIDTRQLSPVGAGCALVLYLCPHGRGMLFTQRTQFRGPRSHLHSTRPTVETHAVAAPVVFANIAAVDVAHHADVYIVD